jgi:hypothetical protein
MGDSRGRTSLKDGVVDRGIDIIRVLVLQIIFNVSVFPRFL